MKLILPILFCVFLLVQKSKAQNDICIDEYGKEISEQEYKKKVYNKSLALTLWLYIGDDGKRYRKLKQDLYLTGVLDYNEIKEKLEIITGRKIKGNNTIILEYYYKNDLCTEERDNKWNKPEVWKRKQFLNPLRKEIKEKNIIFFSIFEKEIELKNNPNNKNEYFYSDLNNYFRNQIFTNPTVCGSYALIKTNGEALIRNGEYRPDYMIEYLKRENWDLFFDTEN